MVSLGTFAKVSKIGLLFKPYADDHNTFCLMYCSSDIWPQLLLQWWRVSLWTSKAFTFHIDLQMHFLALPTAVIPTVGPGACHSNPCVNKGTCVDRAFGSYDCICTPRFTGPHCEGKCNHGKRNCLYCYVNLLFVSWLSTKIIVIQIKGSININIEMPLNDLQFQFLIHLPP